MLTIGPDPRRQGGYLLRGESVVPRPREEVFAFFSDAFQLEGLTPSWLCFEVLTPPPIEMEVGRRIDYRLRLRGLPIRWQSEITTWEPDVRFVDEQRRGPYRYWRHEHQFADCQTGTRVIDEVQYGVPGGALVYRLLVRRDVERIFRFRQARLVEIFAAANGAQQ